MSVPALTDQDLEKLSTVRVITGALVVKGLHSLKSLSFLRNLEDILGREAVGVNDDGQPFPAYVAVSLTCDQL